MEGVGSGEVNRAAQEFAEPPLQADEREQADPGGGVIVHEQIDIARAAGLAPQRRAEQAELPHRELLEHLSVGEKGARHIRGIHGRILPETVPGVKTHRASAGQAGDETRLEPHPSRKMVRRSRPPDHSSPYL